MNKDNFILTERQRQEVANAKINLANANVRTPQLIAVEQSLLALTPEAPLLVQEGRADEMYKPFKAVID